MAFFRDAGEQRLSKQTAYSYVEGILSDRQSDLEQSQPEQSRASRSLAACLGRLLFVEGLTMAIQAIELAALKLIQASCACFLTTFKVKTKKKEFRFKGNLNRVLPTHKVP